MSGVSKPATGFRLRLAAGQLAEIERQARATWPHECCGLFLGTRTARGVEVERLWPAENVHAEPERRFTIDPAELLRAHKAARAEGLGVVGCYHSHPDREAVPSPTDLELAWPETSYLILSVSADSTGQVRSWRLETDGSGFAEELLEVDD